jgi:hypothetical protein
MLRDRTIWKGTEAESFFLLKVVERHCACEFANTGALVRACGPHVAIVTDQRFLDGLVFARRMAGRLLDEEWRTG